jgi:hypothetical protein
MDKLTPTGRLIIATLQTAQAPMSRRDLSETAKINPTTLVNLLPVLEALNLVTRSWNKNVTFYTLSKPAAPIALDSVEATAQPVL